MKYHSNSRVNSKLFGVHRVPEVLYVRGTFTHSRIAQKGARGMERFDEPDIPRPCVKGWNGTFPFSPAVSSLRSFVFRVLTLSDIPKKFIVTWINQSCFSRRKGFAIKEEKRNKTIFKNETWAFFSLPILSCRYVRWRSFPIRYRIMIISISTSRSHMHKIALP